MNAKQSKTVAVIGGGLAGLSSAVALAEAGFRLSLLELRPHLGGRATSYDLPDGSHVDNCQHVTLGCCTNLEDFYRRAGVAGKIHYFARLYFADSHGGRGVIAPSFLPAPSHLALSFLSFPLLTWADKRSIARAMTAILRSGGEPALATDMSMLDWLRGQRQTEAAIEKFWRVVLVSALNEELHRTDARYGVEVFWKGFLSTRRGFEVGIPSVPLAQLYAGCQEAIVKRGGEARLRARAREILFDGARVTGVRLEDGTELPASYVIAAVPSDACVAMMPAGLRAALPALQGSSELRGSPITGVHFWFDRVVMREPFLTLLDRTTQWIFNKSLLYGEAQEESHPGGAAQYLQLVISASYSLVEKSRQEIIDECAADVRAVLPAAAKARLVKATVVKETHATFSPVPGCDRFRPAQKTAVPGLVLAGDWTATGWPATMEGAVRSGYLAAEAVLEAEAMPRRLLVPDLPAEGIARWFTRD